jgi:hypothetical protein
MRDREEKGSKGAVGEKYLFLIHSSSSTDREVKQQLRGTKKFLYE